jgi:hypothetical protein
MSTICGPVIGLDANFRGHMPKVRVFLVALCCAQAGCQSLRSQTVVAGIDVALAAQVEGCAKPTSIERSTTSFFPGLALFSGVCTTGHDIDYVVNAGRSGAGRIFLLNSPAEFRYLIAVHPPTGLTSSSIEAYLALALRYSGRLQHPNSRLVLSNADGHLASVVSRFRASGSEIGTLGVIDSQSSGPRTTFRARALVADEDKLSLWDISVSLPTGTVSAFALTEWPGKLD